MVSGIDILATMNRRQMLVVAGAGAMSVLKARAAAPPKAIVFDTFGTVVDWRGSIIAEGTEWGRAKGLNIDWGKFADRWRAGYGPSMDKVRKGQLPWTKLDVLHRMILDEITMEFRMLPV